ncbi:MAG TPA: DinB family protein [Chloroflexota bacterium]|nr:DinB family protein [Chloroflexota bacterium]
MKDSERRFPPLSGSERDVLNGFLDYQRDTLEWKCSGLTEAQMKEPLASHHSPLTLLGLLRHMTEVEYFWFENVLLDRNDHFRMYSKEDPEGDFKDLGSCSAEEVMRRWKEACDTARRNAATLPEFDSTAARNWDDQPVMLRWIVAHMIEEYARHNGHADLLRERIDGETGE